MRLADNVGLGEKESRMRKNELRKIIADGKTVLNAWLAIANPFSAELMAHQGFDAVTIDLQHGPVDAIRRAARAVLAPTARFSMAAPTIGNTRMTKFSSSPWSRRA